MEGDLKSSSSFTIGNTAQETGLSYLPDCYVFQPSHRPSLAPEVANIPIIDFAMLKQNPSQRAQVITAIGNACRRFGYFQIINHGICPTTLEGALSAASDYFELPMEEKIKLMSNDVRKPVRYGTSIRDGTDKFQFWRVFLKHYAYPLSDWLDLWPNNPPHYREKMGKYCQEARKLALELMVAITESLGLGPTYLGSKMEEGVHVMAVNCYPPCPKPDMALGLPPHSDYSCLTILLQSSPGLEIMDPEDGKWKAVPDQLHGTLQVQVGDHLEVLSNGLYKSILHRVTLNSQKTRISIASLHSLGADEKMGTAKELVNDQHPERYKESSFRDFLNFISSNDIGEGKSFKSTLIRH